MALTTKKSISVTGTSTIDNIIAARFTASIDSSDPSNMSVTAVQVNKTTYKANRTQCRADQAEFEDYAYSLQDELLAELETEEETEE